VTTSRCVVLAVGRTSLCSSLGYALHRAGLEPVEAEDVGELLDLLAGDPHAMVLSDPFAGLHAEALLALVRTTGCDVPALIVASAMRNEVLARASELAPLELMSEPSPVAASPCRGRPPRLPARRWLGRCVELATHTRAP